MPSHHSKNSSFGPGKHLVVICHKVSTVLCTLPSISTLGRWVARSPISCKFRTLNLFVTHKLSKLYLLRVPQKHLRKVLQWWTEGCPKRCFHRRSKVSCKAVRGAYTPETTNLEALLPPLFETTWESQEKCMVFNTTNTSGSQQHQFICERTQR